MKIKVKIDGRETVLTFEGLRWDDCQVYHEPRHVRAHTFHPTDIQEGTKFRVNGHAYEIVQVMP